MSAAPNLNRTAFITDRALEFFTEAELTTQLGYGRTLWPLVLVKELIDNALDACETGNTAPEIVVTLEPDALTVVDNGPGVPPEIVERSLDYHVRISDKKHYISPTRGQLGNALKCVWAVLFVVDGKHGLTEVSSCGLNHRIEVTLDRIAQKPVISHSTKPSVKIGTSVKVHWNGVACYRLSDYQLFYQPEPEGETEDEEWTPALDEPKTGNFLPHLILLLRNYAAFNPHASFSLNDESFPASDPDWRNWRPDHPTSAHWYRTQDLRDLIAAYINEADRPVRDFVAEFDGLKGTRVRKAVLEQAAISATHLSDLVVDQDVDMKAVSRLLSAMQNNCKPVDPKRLGLIGKDHLEKVLLEDGCEGVRYRKTLLNDDDGLPCVLETAFGVRTSGQRHLIIGMNWAPIFKIPSGAINNVLTNCHVQHHDPVTLLIHLVKPRFEFTDHGKGALAE
jgi:Histidine kinase-, DNA gyrase B-, and HSP90-like ATPase